jgi:hypothetical protein
LRIAVITGPLRAEIDVDKIVNEVMKEATKGMVETNAKSISDDSFRRLYGRARTSAQYKFDVQSGTLKSIASEKRIETEASGGSWRLMIAGWRGDNSSDDIYIQEAPALIMNYGRRFQYIFVSQDIKPKVYEKVSKKLAKLHREITSEYKDMEVEISRYENKMMINANYHYVDGEGQIEDRLTFLMRRSHEMITDLLVEAPKMEKEARNELGEQTLSYLNRDDFMFLVDDGYENFSVKEGAKEGHWEFSNKATKAQYETFNFGDRLVFSMYEQMPGVTSEEQRDEIVKKVDALVAQKPAEGANSMEVLRHPEAMHYVWVKAHFALDGQIRGKKLAAYYKDFKQNYAADFHKKIMDVFKEYEKAAEKSQKDFKNRKFSFLTQDEYIQLADDDLEGNLDPAEGVQEGHWTFTVGEEERDCEIFNYGDRIIYTLAAQMPSDDEEVYAEIMEKVQTLVHKMPAEKSASMEVTRYPGYDNYVWVKASYALDGGLKGKDLNKQYQAFVYDYSEALYIKITSIFDPALT